MRKKQLFTQAVRDRIIDLLREFPDSPLSASDIGLKLDARGGARKQVRLLLDTMVLEGLIIRIRHDRYTLGKAADLVTGSLDVFRSGDGVVVVNDGSGEVFVPKTNLGTALPQDVVVARLDPGAERRIEEGARRTGKVIRVLERSRRAIVGTLKSTQHFYYVVPLDPAYSQDFYVPDAKGGKVNDRVVIQFCEWENKHVNPEAEIIEIIGPASNPSLDTMAIIRHYGLSETFPPAVLKEAELAPNFLNERGQRQDFRDRFVFTIDPTTSRDYDDALSLDRDKEGRRVLGVHIADVAHFVRKGSAMDMEARQRGNSVYLPDRVLPMLPEQLSNGLCSLRPGDDRLTFSVLITFSDTGVPVASTFCRGVIRSRLRLTYEQALEALRGPSGKDYPKVGMSAEAVALLKHVNALAKQLRERRFANFALDLDMPEYEVIMGSDDMISEIHRNVNDESHQLIEECMVAANEAVDRWLSLQGWVLLHRVHEPPANEKIEDLTAKLVDMGFKPGDVSKRRNLAAFLKSIHGHPFEYDAMLATLKSMKRALYSPQPLGHYGLAKKYYAHFTSPIRRYPDLVVHRILSAALERRPNPYAGNELMLLGLGCSKTEQTADAAEKALLEIKKYRFLEQQIKRGAIQVNQAVVVRVKNFGMFVELTELQIQGLVHVSVMSREFVRYDAVREMLRVGKIGYKRGSRVNVVVTKVDLDKRQIDFAMTEQEAGTIWRGSDVEVRHRRHDRRKRQEPPIR